MSPLWYAASGSRDPEHNNKMARILTFTSGSEGVGKSCLAAQLAARLARRGQRARLLQADARQAVPAGERQAVDFFLVDAAAGVDDLTLASPELLVVITPEPESLSDAYGLLKALAGQRGLAGVQVVVNRCRNHTVGRHSFDKFREVVQFYLGTELSLLGLVHEDARLQEAGAGVPAALGETGAVRDIAELADRLLQQPSSAASGTLEAFWQSWQGGVEAQQADRPAEPVPVADDRVRTELARLLDSLGGRVDALIAEVERLRTAPAAVPAPAGPPAVARLEPLLARFAAERLDAGSGDLAFDAWRVEQPGGGQLLCAWQDAGDARAGLGRRRSGS
ncbi:MAG TPA: hypothetical protein ENK12_11920 [Gammaproteobacteria bacterium]|nr:hypothetical protein [Gammaproteobacteria bacterium]